PSHTSISVQNRPSSQADPSGSTGLLQPPIGSQRSSVHGSPSTQFSGVPSTHPVIGSQVSTPLQPSSSSQSSGVPFTHCPVWQVPFVVQASPQAVLSGMNASAGQGALVPSHVSAMSQPVATGRQTVPPGSVGCVQV